MEYRGFEIGYMEKCGFYIVTKELSCRHLWKDGTFHGSTGWSGSPHRYGEAPGYYKTQEVAIAHIDAYLREENSMKIGDKVTMRDGSYSFGIQDGQYGSIHGIDERVLAIVQTGLHVMRDYRGRTSGTFNTICDLLITDGEGNFFFAQSRSVEPVAKKIEVRYYCEGDDVTNRISDETKRNLRR